ncbi:MAG TPA: protein translocase subunit SecF, partial [Petrotogaceae bacterium]|nr:protein translocase subunit SecF [Petrotogaceae bacterium]
MRNIDFVGKRRIFIAISAVLVLAFVIISFTKGFDVGVEYSGGTELTFSINEKMSSSEIRDNLAKVKPDYVSAKIVELKSPAEKQDRHFYQVVVKDSLPTTEEKETFIGSLQTAFDGKDLQKEGLNDVSGAAAVELKS